MLTKRARRLIAGLELAGGGLGMLFASQMALTAGLTIMQRIAVGSVGLPFGFVALAGRELWNETDFGVPFSMVAQALQVFSWSSPSLFYNLACGIQLGLWIGPTVLQPRWYFGSTFTISIAAEPRGTALGLNLLAIWLFMLLWVARDGVPERPDPAPLKPLDPPQV